MFITLCKKTKSISTIHMTDNDSTTKIRLGTNCEGMNDRAPWRKVWTASILVHSKRTAGFGRECRQDARLL